MLLKLMLVYLLVINAAAMLLMLIDKIRAKKNKWRIPERRLLLFAALGGSLGSLAGMYLFRHKTQHLKFTMGVPIILAMQIIGAIVVLLYVQAG